ncbi:hypothetical protein EDB84DRAFT_1559385 [Lactarius hengduanensis]|nr:hypothetical protein EDB84DRAFT_1559385 [Lactarius hengduanensis]
MSQQPPSAIIHLTVPSQEGVPDVPSTLPTPHSLVSMSPPLPVLTLATMNLGQTNPVDGTLYWFSFSCNFAPMTTPLETVTAPLSLMPQVTFSAAQGYSLTPLSSPKPVKPDPHLTLLNNVKDVMPPQGHQV